MHRLGLLCQPHLSHPPNTQFLLRPIRPNHLWLSFALWRLDLSWSFRQLTGILIRREEGFDFFSQFAVV